MTSKFNIDDALPETYQHKYRGLVFTLKTVPDHGEFHRLTSEYLVKYGVDDDEEDIDTMAEQTKLARERAAGSAMIGTFVVGIDPFKNGDYEFHFNAPSEMPEYKTQAQELFGENSILHNAIYRHCVVKSDQLPDYEVEALGKSLTPSDSGDSLTQTAEPLQPTALIG